MKPTLFASLVLLAAAAMPAGVAAQAPATVRVGVDVDAGTLDPRLARDTTAFRAADLIYDGLVRLSPDLQPMPGLAESWENPEPNVWVFHLRDGVAFHDGTPLTADDVVFTYESIIDPEFNAPFRALFSPIRSVEAVDDRTVRFTLDGPYAPLLSYLDVGIVPAAAVAGGHDIALSPIGTGPMKLVGWDRGSAIRLAANPDYFAGPPRVEALDLVIVGDNTARAQAFEAGDLDLIQSPLSPQDIRRLEADDRFGHAIESGLGITYLNFNTADPLLAEPGIRQALAMLVDQETIVGQIYEGVDKVATSVLLPSSWAYTDEARQPTFDPEGAKARLAELGWTDSDGDGVLDKDGAPLALTLATHSEDPNRVQAIEFLQATLQGAGIDAEVRITDWPSFSTGYVQESEHQVALLGWLNLVDPDRGLYGQLVTGGPLNWGKYSNPALDEALAEGRAALDLEARKQAYRTAATIIAEELPYYVVSYQGYQLFYDPDLGTLAVNPRGYLRNILYPGE